MKHTHPVPLLLALALGAGCAQPQATTYAQEMSRTGFGRGDPDGEGCRSVVTTSTDATPVTDSSGPLQLFELPAQLWLVNNSTAAADYCFSMDPSPIIARDCLFSADPSGYYAAGDGPATTLPSGGAMYFGLDRAALQHQATARVGGRPRKCASTDQPCLNNSECSSGVCGTGPPTHVYLFVVHNTAEPARSKVCDHR